MLASVLIFAAATLLGSALGGNGKCHGQRMYCGRSLKNMGESPLNHGP